MKSLVTGASGFVGRHLVNHLIDCGDDVYSTDRSTGGPDLLDAKGLGKLVSEVSPEVIYHLAGQADVALSWSAPTLTFRTNVEGTLNILISARAADVRRVLTVTSADIYGRVEPKNLPINENAPIRPVSPYAASKAAADVIALQAYLGHGQDVVRARSFNQIGPGQSDRFVGSAIAARVAHNEREGSSELCIGNLDSSRDFTDVRDVVRAYRLLACHGRQGLAYNVCSGQSTSIRDLANSLLEMAKLPMNLVTDPNLFRPADILELRGDPTLLTSDTGWIPERRLDETLADLLQDWRKQKAQTK